MKQKIIIISLLISSFANAQTINISFPNGGEKFIKNNWSPHNITWESSEVSNVKIEYSTDNGTNWQTIETNYPNTNYYSWNIPDIESSECKIKISDTNSSITDISDNTFEISSHKLYIAQWNTSMGVIRAELRGDITPITSQNFINLAEKGFYSDLIFHRVISGFMIQDGCPIGDGTGDPGYSFDDEFNSELHHSFPGVLSMANAGPNTNGSQYFITVEPTPWLDNHHTVFGRIIDGMDVVYAISEVETDSNDKPLTDVDLSINIVESTPSLTLQYPSENLKIEKGRQINILWDSDFIPDAKIEFSSNNGGNWTSITDSIPSGEESFAWSVPDIVSSECIIKITSLRDENIYSQNTFEIRDKPANMKRFELYENVIPSVDNPENIISAGKIIKFKVKIENLSIGDLTSVTANLVSNSESITVNSGTTTFNDIAENNSKWSESEFEIQLPETLPGNGQFSFSLFGTATNVNDDFWIGDFNIPFVEIFPFITIDDDTNGNSNGNNNKILENNETIELNLPINNKSSEILYNVYGKLTSNANYINIWNEHTGINGIVYDTTKYNGGNPINPSSSFVQQENLYVFEYNEIEPYSTDFILITNYYVNEPKGISWDDGGILVKCGVTKTLNNSYPPANVFLLNKDKIKIVQNPVYSKLLISYNLIENKNILTIFDLQGKKKITKKLGKGKKKEQIDVSFLKNGIYILTINNFYQKFVIIE